MAFDRAAYGREYQKRPEVIARRRAGYLRRRDKILAAVKARYDSPAEQARRATPEWKSRQRDQMRAWRQRLTPAQVAARNEERAARQVVKLYGVTFEEALRLQRVQRCAVCAAALTEDPARRSSRRHIDHDHATGRVRDVLCHRCNCAIGFALDDPARLRALAKYVEAHNARREGAA